MSRKLSIFSLVAVAAVAAAPGAVAGERVKVDVPFTFVVAGQPLPSGEYRFDVDETTRIVHVYSTDRAHVALTVCQPAPSASREVGLVFHEHAGKRFLKAVSTGHGFDVTLPTAPAEKMAETADGVGRPVAGMP